MRLFIAFKVPHNALAEFQKTFSFEGLQFVDDFHCTLKFLGDVPENNVAEIIERLRRVTYHPFLLHLENTGVFPPYGPARVLWVGFNPEAPVLDLHHKVDDVLDGMFSKDDRFVAHITLGRVKDLKDKEQFKSYVKKAKVPAVDFVVEEFCLFKSEFSEEGVVHTVLETF
jgi:RNA 2',3'-cyclic 3'-phosphodiesterase